MITKKQIKFLVASHVLLLLSIANIPCDARGGHGGRGHGFPGPGFGGRHAGYANHYDNYGRWGRYGIAGAGAWGGWARPRNRFYHYGWGGAYEPYYGGPGYGAVAHGTQSIDAEGNLYPAIPYVTGGAGYVDMSVDASQVVSAEIKTKPDIEPVKMKAVETKSAYKLGPDVDILENGTIAARLNDDSFLLVNAKETLVVNQKDGVPVMSLYTDPALLFNIAYELKRQSLGLQAKLMDKQAAANGTSKAASDSATEVHNLKSTLDLIKSAQDKLGTVADQPPAQTADPAPDVVELFSSTWLVKDGSFILYKQSDGSLVYMNSSGTFSDRGKTTRQVAYPASFEITIYKYLQTLLSEYQPTMSKLSEDKDDTEWALSKLAEVEESDMLEAKRRLQQAVSRSERRLSVIDSQLDSMPDEVSAAKKTLAMLDKT